MARTAKVMRKIVEEAHDLPTLPTVITRIMDVVQNPNALASDVGSIMSEDQALTAKTLRLVNSAFYGFPRRITNMTRAIVILGFAKVKNIALSASVFDTFKGKASLFDSVAFWEHSLGTAIAADTIAKGLGIENADDAFVGGLIHDLGKVVLIQFLEPEYEEVAAIVKKQDILFVEAEATALEVNHGTIGRWLAEKWNFPPELVNCVWMHHAPSMVQGDRGLASVVHLGDIVSRALDIGSGGDTRIPEVNETAWDELGLSLGLIDRFIEETITGIEKAGAFFELIRGRS